MKKIVYNLSFCSIVLLVFIFSFCSRQNEEEFLPQANIQITSPAEHALVRYGETLLIRGTATGTKELHGYEIEIRKQGGSSLYYQHYHGHDLTINIEENWKNTLNETADMEIVIIVILDHELHKQTKTVRFRIQN